MRLTPTPAAKSNLHPRNPHGARYDFPRLIAGTPELAAYVQLNQYGDESVDFADPAAVKALNRALLKQYYDIHDWNIPAQYLCPPIPGRADYLHYLADLLAESKGDIPRGAPVRVLDIGTGANCVYPLVGHRSYGWQFVGTDIDAAALQNAQRILQANNLSEAIELRLQSCAGAIFSGVTYADEFFDLTLCNPPFHASQADARRGSQRKWKNLGKTVDRQQKPVLNFGGNSRELCCEGGEASFVRRMIDESVSGQRNCLWFTSLVSKASSLPLVYRALKHIGVTESRTIDMSQGQKKSRILAWTFLDPQQRREWWQRRAV